jgi:hypothetical protein
MNWYEASIIVWFALQLPFAIIVGRAMKQSSFDVEASSVETAGSGHSPPAPALNLLCHSEGVL